MQKAFKLKAEVGSEVLVFNLLSPLRVGILAQTFSVGNREHKEEKEGSLCSLINLI